MSIATAIENVEPISVVELHRIDTKAKRYLDLESQIAALDAERRQLRSELLGALGDAEVGHSKKFAIENRESISQRFQSNVFRTVYPEMWERFKGPCSSYRFRVYSLNK